MHGCTPIDGAYHTITAIDGASILELNGQPVVDVINELYGNAEWQAQRPVVSLLTIGVNRGERYGTFDGSSYVNRLITGVLPNGTGIGIFEPDLSEGDEIQFMIRDSGKMIESARMNTEELLLQIAADGRTPMFGLYIDCAGRTARESNTLTEEAAKVQNLLNRQGIPLLGFYSGVEIAPLLDRNRGLDWTGVLLMLTSDGNMDG